MNRSLRTASIVSPTPLELLHFTAESLVQLVEEVPASKKESEDTAAARAVDRAAADESRQSEGSP